MTLSISQQIKREIAVTFWVAEGTNSPYQGRLVYAVELSLDEALALIGKTADELTADQTAQFDQWKVNQAAAQAAAEAAANAVPQSVPMRAAMQVMFNAGIIDAVQDFVVAAGAEATFWTSATLERNNPLLVEGAPAIWPNLTDDQRSATIDELMRQAALLPA